MPRYISNFALATMCVYVPMRQCSTSIRLTNHVLRASHRHAPVNVGVRSCICILLKVYACICVCAYFPEHCLHKRGPSACLAFMKLTIRLASPALHCLLSQPCLPCTYCRLCLPCLPCLRVRPASLAMAGRLPCLSKTCSVNVMLETNL